MHTATIRRSGALAAAAALSFVAAVAVAQERPRDTAKSLDAKVETKGIGGADAPNARLAALIDAGGFPIRTKGVQSVERIDTGVYCIRPTAASGINVNTAIASVSVEYFYSQDDEVMVQWASRSSGCGSGRIGVYTFSDANNNADYIFSNVVGFSIVVP